MNINFLKCGLISAATVVGLVGLFSGCTESSNDPVDLTTSSSFAPPSSETPYSEPAKKTDISPIRFNSFDVTPKGDRSEFVFEGSATLDAWDTTIVESDIDPYFTGVYLKLARVDEMGNKFETPLNDFFTYNEGAFPRGIINFIDMNVRISDPYKTECGTYLLTAYLYATNDDPNDPDYKADRFVSIDSLLFERNPQFCVEIPVESSSSEAVIPKVELVKGEGTFHNTTNMAFSFITGQETTTADGNITFTLTADDEIKIHGINGFLVTPYTNNLDKNYNDDWSIFELPAEPAHMSDFRFNTNNLTTDENSVFDNERFFIATGPNFNMETGDDFYAFILKDAGNTDANGTKAITIIFYKKK